MFEEDYMSKFALINSRLIAQTPYSDSSFSMSHIQWRGFDFFVTTANPFDRPTPAYRHVIGPEDLGESNIFGEKWNMAPDMYIEAARRFYKDNYAGLTLEEFLDRMFPM